jgi:hypothetical protein
MNHKPNAYLNLLSTSKLNHQDIENFKNKLYVSFVMITLQENIVKLKMPISVSAVITRTIITDYLINTKEQN